MLQDIMNPIELASLQNEVQFDEDEVEAYINKVEDLQDTIEQGHPHYVYFS